MPVLSFPNLLKGRPALAVFVGAPAGWNESCEALGLPVVYPIEAAALIDTGAARTLVAASLIKALGLPALGDAPAVFGIAIGGRPVPAAEFAVSLTFAGGPPLPATTALPMSAVPDDALAGTGLQLLLGRDFLARVVMVVHNWPEDRLTLAV
jgi:hypothetical protein